jgi:hypothetical protein
MVSAGDLANLEILEPGSASKIGFGKYIRLEEMGTIGGATGADYREK